MATAFWLTRKQKKTSADFQNKPFRIFWKLPQQKNSCPGRLWLSRKFLRNLRSSAKSADKISSIHVVPHMHWHMIRFSDGRDLGYKQCPRILLDRGRLGAKWNAFLSQVAFYAREGQPRFKSN